jgi:hypothetical protein
VDGQQLRYIKMVIDNMQYVEKHPYIMPTFHGVAKAVALQNGVSQEEVEEVLQVMIEKEYLCQKERNLGPDNNVKMMEMNWKLLEGEGYCINYKKIQSQSSQSHNRYQPS